MKTIKDFTPEIESSQLYSQLHECHFDTANLIGRKLALHIDGKEVEDE